MPQAAQQPPQQQPPQTPPAQQGHAARDVAVAYVATQVAPTPAPPVEGGVKVLLASVLGTFVTFLAALREQHRQWLTGELARYSRSPRDIADAVAREMVLESEFAKNSANRLAAALPVAFRIADPGQREQRVKELFDQEERYAQQRSEAMAARAIAAVQRAGLRSSSPLGAFWRLGHATKHTEGCLFMAGRFWPWSVLDRVHPPRHYGCTSDLVDYATAVTSGLMGPSDVPDERQAINAALGVVMQQEDAGALLRELDVRDRLVEQGVSADALQAIPLRGVGDGGG